MSEIARRLAELPKDLRLLISHLWKEKRDEAGAENDGVARSQPFGLISEADRQLLPKGLEDAYPLSQVQLGMLFHMQQTRDDPTPAYHNVNSFPLRVEFVPWAFRIAVQRVVARHPMLRTSFDQERYSEALQLIHREATLRVEVVDLRRLKGVHQRRILEGFIRDQNRSMVDVSRASLWKFTVHLWADDGFHLTLVEPHAISDGWSATSTLAEMFDLYVRLKKGEDVPIQPPPTFTHRDYVLLERQAQESGEARDFFRKKLADRNVTPLPRRAPLGETFSVDRDRKPTWRLEPERVEALHQVSRSLGIPMKSVLLAAHFKVLSLVSGQTDLITGWTIHGRPEELEGDTVRGMFLNTLPLRVSLRPGRWNDLIHQIFEAEVELLEFRHYPLASVQSDVGERVLFDTGFSYLHFRSVEPTLTSGEVRVQSVGGSDLSVTHFPLMATFSLNPIATSVLELTLEHDPKAFSAVQIKSIRGYYERVLTELGKDPGALHHTRTFLSSAERHQLRVEWNRNDFEGFEEDLGDALSPSGSMLLQLFEAVVEDTPHAVALVLERSGLTYGELDRRARQLALELRSRGVAPGARVAVAVNRSLELVTAILGVLKAGGAYVPLDPSYPEERLHFMRKDARVALVVTRKRYAETFAESGSEVVCLDGDLPVRDRRALEAPVASAQADDPMYVIYTSGSTGMPKGVVVTHRNAMRLFSTTGAALSFSANDTWTLFHSCAFDFSVWELWGSLAYGGCLSIVPYEVSRSPEDFARLLARQRVTVLNQTPSAFRALIDLDRRSPDSLRLIILGGEALEPGSLKPWFARHGESPPLLINMYGITETTVHATYRAMDAVDVANPASSRIGRPLPDLQIYLLDLWGQLAARGATGQICVGGPGLAAGYLRRPALTAARFVPNPLGERSGARLYTSGDLGRIHIDGDMEYLGRIDQQVKIRGFRIELGEIEVELGRQPGVRRAVVTLREDEPGDRRLVAYLVLNAEEAPGSADIRGALRNRLPEYMVPSDFVTLESLPQTPNGKLDRRALPAPQLLREDPEETFVPPRSDLERSLVKIWQKVLKVEQVGIYDNFFDLGGNSLLLLKVHQRLNKLLKRRIEFLDLLEFTNIQRLAEHLGGEQADRSSFEQDAQRGRRRRGMFRRQQQRRRDTRGEKG